MGGRKRAKPNPKPEILEEPRAASSKPASSKSSTSDATDDAQEGCEASGNSGGKGNLAQEDLRNEINNKTVSCAPVVLTSPLYFKRYCDKEAHHLPNIHYLVIFRIQFQLIAQGMCEQSLVFVVCSLHLNIEMYVLMEPSFVRLVVGMEVHGRGCPKLPRSRRSLEKTLPQPRES